MSATWLEWVQNSDSVSTRESNLAERRDVSFIATAQQPLRKCGMRVSKEAAKGS